MLTRNVEFSSSSYGIIQHNSCCQTIWPFSFQWKTNDSHFQTFYACTNESVQDATGKFFNQFMYCCVHCNVTTTCMQTFAHTALTILNIDRSIWLSQIILLVSCLDASIRWNCCLVPLTICHCCCLQFQKSHRKMVNIRVFS